MLLRDRIVENESLSETAIVLYVDSMTPSLKNIEILHQDELRKHLIEESNCTKTIFMNDISYRSNQRNILYNRICTIIHTMCFLGLLGIILMIIENEMNFRNIYHQQTILSLSIKTTISITTMILITLVIYYNRLNLEMYAFDNLLGSWRVALTRKKIILILLEILICSIHPFPRYQISNPSKLIHPIPLSYIEIDVILSLPMFTRIYLLCRFLMFHSHLMRNASSQSLKSLNQVSINFFFLFKTYLARWPIYSLSVFSISLFLIGSWSFRACNYTSDLQHVSMTDSLWLLIITFTTVGYGDVTPSTYCGRSIAAIIGLIGILSTALFISILAQKLQLTRAEKYIYNFLLNRQLPRERCKQVDNINKYDWKVWHLQRKLIRSFRFNHRLTRKQTKLYDRHIDRPEIMTTRREINEQIQQMIQRSMQMEQILLQINQKMINIYPTNSH